MPLCTWRMPRAVYDRMIETGILGEDDPIELLAGRLIVAEPKHSPHETAVHAVADALRGAFGRGWHVRIAPPSCSGLLGTRARRVSRSRVFRDYRDPIPPRPHGSSKWPNEPASGRRIKASIYAAVASPTTGS